MIFARSLINRKDLNMIRTILSILFAMPVIVGNAQSMLRVGLADRTPVTVSVDGRYFNKRGETVTVGDLPQGRHYIKIYAISNTSGDKAYQQIVYEGRVRTYRGQLTLMTCDSYNGTAVTSQEPMGYAMNGTPNGPESYNNQKLNNYDTRDNYGNSGTGNMDTQPNNQEQPGTGNSEEPKEVYDDLPAGTPLASPVASPVNSDETKATTTAGGSKLDKIKKKIVAKNTDTERMEAAKESFKKEKLTTTQVCTVMDWFSFESSKVEFAEWAYPNVSDKQNYSKVKSKITNKTYKDEFDSFLKKKN